MVESEGLEPSSECPPKRLLRPGFFALPREISSQIGHLPETLRGKGREKDVARKTAVAASPQTASSALSKPVHVQASLEMARPRLELGTPRFSVVCSTN